MTFRLSASVAVLVSLGFLPNCKAAERVPVGGRVPLHPDSGAPALVTLRANSGSGLRPQRPDQPLPEFIAVWADGTILWSPRFERDEVRCFRAGVPAERVQQAVASLVEVVDDPALTRRSYVIPDSAYDEVVLFDGERMISIASCIHLWESHPTGVATDHGIVLAVGGDRDAVTRSRSAELNKLIDAWHRCTSEIRRLVPTEGTPTPPPANAWWDSRTGRCRVIETCR